MTAKRAIPLWIWGIVAAAVAFALYNAYEARVTKEMIHRIAVTLDQQIEMQRESAQQLSAARREALILTDPQSMKVAMPPENKDLPILRATWHPEFGLLIRGQHLPAVKENHTLQLWLVPKGAGAKATPSLTVHPGADGIFELLVANPPYLPSGTKTLAITEEPEGGSALPTSAPIWIGRLRGK